MKCPHCEYEHGWSPEKLDVIEGDSGDFFTLSNGVVATRPVYLDPAETTPVHFCPSCGKAFIEVN